MRAIGETLCENGISEDRIVPVSDNNYEALRRLVALSHDLLPHAYKDAFISAQKVDLERKQPQAKAIIHTASVAAAAAAAVPLPISDALVILPIQTGMIAKLAYLYGLPVEGAVAALGSFVAAAVGTMTASSLVKLLPGIGSLIQAGVAAALTESLGHMANKYLLESAEAEMASRPGPDIGFDSDEFGNMTTKLIEGTKD
ncbi:MAG: DUF697 domain-containing protein [Pseudomonadota bacterium]